MVEGTSSEISQSKNNKNSNYKKPYNKFNIRKNHYNNDNINKTFENKNKENKTSYELYSKKYIQEDNSFQTSLNINEKPFYSKCYRKRKYSKDSETDYI